MHPRILISIIFTFSFFIFSFPAFAQKVIQCTPGMATINNNLTVSGNLTVNNDAIVKNNLSVERDIFAASGGQRIYLGNNTSSPFITNNAGNGVLFYSQGGQNFLWQSLTNPNPDAMILRSGGGLPNNNGYNLQVFGQVSSYQMHTQGIHIDMQGGIGPVPRPNILKITNSAATGTGVAIFLGDPGAYDNNSIIFSEYTAGQDIGKIMMTMNTASGNVGVATVNPQITLAIGDNDTGLKWNSDGNFSLYTNNSERMKIDPAGDVTISNNLCLGGVCQSAWPAAISETDPTVLASIKDGVAWGEVSGIPADISDGDQIGITSVPNCTATQKLTGAGGVPVCANDIDTDTNTDAQTLSVVGSTLSISGGNSVTLPAAAVDTLDTVTANGSTTGNSISVGGLTITGGCVGGFIRAGTWCTGRGVNGNEGKVLIKSVTSSGSADFAAGGWTTLDIPTLNGTNAKFVILRAFCSEARIHLRRVGSGLAEGNWNTGDSTLACAAGNNSQDWMSLNSLFIVELDANKDIDWNLDATDPPSMTANLYLIGYID